MFNIDIVVFNYDMVAFWIAVCSWLFMFWCMPKRAIAGLIISVLVATWYLTIPHDSPEQGQFIYVGWVMFMGTFFTACMSPIALIGFFLGYKTTS